MALRVSLGHKRSLGRGARDPAGGARADGRVDHPDLGGWDPVARLRVAEAAGERFGWPLRVVDGAPDDSPIEQPRCSFRASTRRCDCPRGSAGRVVQISLAPAETSASGFPVPREDDTNAGGIRPQPPVGDGSRCRQRRERRLTRPYLSPEARCPDASARGGPPRPVGRPRDAAARRRHPALVRRRHDAARRRHPTLGRPPPAAARHTH
jgi:hypothetical protein